MNDLVMRRIATLIIVLALGLSALACSQSARTVSVSDNKALVSPGVNSASTPTSGSGVPSAPAIDDSAQAQVKSPLPPPTGFVNDYAKVIDERTKDKLEATLRELKKQSNIEFAVVTVDTTGEQSSFDYTMAVARGWGVGSKSENGGGLILLLAIKDRKWEIRWTRNLEADLQDEMVDELKRQMIEPLRQGKYGEGITNAVQVVIARLSERRGFSLNQ